MKIFRLKLVENLFFVISFIFFPICIFLLISSHIEKKRPYKYLILQVLVFSAVCILYYIIMIFHLPLVDTKERHIKIVMEQFSSFSFTL